VSYKTGSGREILFVSKSALLDGSKPVRGGIPVVFPIFGPPPPSSSDATNSNSIVSDSTMPQHGYARRNNWDHVRDYDDAESAGIVFRLELNKASDGRGEHNIWQPGSDCDCTLVLTVDFTGKTIATTLTIENTGHRAFPFQALLHTYYKVENGAALQNDQCFVNGLEGYTVSDKVTPVAPYTADATPITIAGEVDRVYDPPADKKVVDVSIGVGNGHQTVSMTAEGMVDGKSVPVSCVVWNPFVEKAAGMSDFGNEEYHDMICVEPGILDRNTLLEGGKVATLTQNIVTAP
jgi:glucose-6-phosphate 1-epimerase